MKDNPVNQFIIDVNEPAREECMKWPFAQSSVYWNGRSMSYSRATCGVANGWEGDDLMKSPVRTCNTKRCANGHHYRWGTLAESRSVTVARFGDQTGAKNNNAKLNWDKVREIRAAKGLGGQGNITHEQFYARRALCEKFGISLRTLKNVLDRSVWIEEPVHGGKEGDAF